MTFKKGDPRPPNSGRRKGSKNRVNLAFKDCVVNVLRRGGGEAWLLRWAKRNPTEFFKIAARLIPQELLAKVDHTHTADEGTRKLLDALNPEQLRAVAAVLAQAGRVAELAGREDGAGGKVTRRVH